MLYRHKTIVQAATNFRNELEYYRSRHQGDQDANAREIIQRLKAVPKRETIIDVPVVHD